MRKIAYRVDPDFRHYTGNTDAAGHLPDLGISGYIDAKTEEVGFEWYEGLDAGRLKAFEVELFGLPNYHHICNAAIAFWPKTPCWRCKGVYSPHGLVSKRVSLHEEIETVRGIGSAGFERVGLCKPQLFYSGIGSPLAFLPYAAERMDRVLAGVWVAIATDLRLVDLLDGRPAEINYQFSQQYEGNYWALTCPHCSALQGEYHLKASSLADKNMPMSIEPQLLVLPKIRGEDSLGGKVIARLSAVRI